MTSLSAPPPFPVPWRVVVTHRGETFEHITEPKQTAWQAAASIRCADGQQPHFSQCQCEIYQGNNP